jgi:hypothetical protein
VAGAGVSPAGAADAPVASEVPVVAVVGPVSLDVSGIGGGVGIVGGAPVDDLGVELDLSHPTNNPATITAAEAATDKGKR